MGFSSISFLYYFLPCVLVLYFIVPSRLKNTILLIASFVFYAWGEPKFVVIMTAVIVQGYVFGLLIEKYRGRPAKIYLAASCFISLSAMVYCKYADFFIENFNAATGLSVPLLRVSLHIGISFYILEMLSYVIDVYRTDAPAQKNFIDLAMYISMFPQLIAGPIVRYSDIVHQLKHRTHSLDKTSNGIRRFVIGLGQKVLIADVLGTLCESYKSSSDKSVAYVWLYAVAYSLLIFFELSGYSNMAIGLAKIFGFEFCDNFRYPYISRSITEFWHRWFISLGTWFKEYVYLPLCKNSVKKRHISLNIMIVLILIGFWHKAAWNLILWGAYFGVLLITETLFLKKYLDKSKVLSRIYVIFAVIFSFVLFDASSISQALETIRSMLWASDLPMASEEAVYMLKSYAAVIIIAVIGSTPLASSVINKLNKTKHGKMLTAVCEPIFLVLILLLSTAYIVDGSFDPFLHFRF